LPGDSALLEPTPEALAERLLDLGDPDAALEVLDRALRRDPGSDRARALRHREERHELGLHVGREARVRLGDDVDRGQITAAAHAHAAGLRRDADAGRAQLRDPVTDVGAETEVSDLGQSSPPGRRRVTATSPIACTTSSPRPASTYCSTTAASASGKRAPTSGGK